MPKHMVHPQGNGIAQNTKYEEMTKYGIYVSSKFAQKRKSSDNSKIVKGLKTTPPKKGAYDHVSYFNMLNVMICYTMIW